MSINDKYCNEEFVKETIKQLRKINKINLFAHSCTLDIISLKQIFYNYVIRTV